MNLSYLANATLLSPRQSLCNTATPAASSITSGVAISLRRAHLAPSTGPCRHQKVCVSTRQGYSSLTAKTFPMPSATFVLYELRSCHCNATDKAFAVHVVLAGSKSLLYLFAAPIERTCSGRDVQLLLPFQNLCDSTRSVLPVWVAKLPFHHAIQSCRQPVPTFAIEGFH